MRRACYNPRATLCRHEINVMRLEEGRRLGDFEVVASLGSGGMGEVYSARDLRLGRDVALKVLPEALSREPERLARFNREARVLASLNHANIAVIHGLQEHDGVLFLVLELVPGATLAEHLAAGPLPVRGALDVCRQVAEALEQAHARGVVHRDLKPSNVKVTPEGQAKVLDFGLAKALAGDADDITSSPTGELATREGLVMGTAAYMSPEQARGQDVTQQADVWAFGCLLFEALTGRQAFEGGTVSDRLVSVLTGEPDWTALPVATPGVVRFLLRRCLQKDVALRLPEIRLARVALEEALQDPSSQPREVLDPSPPAAPRRSWPVPAALLVLGLVIGAGAVLVARRGGPAADVRVRRFGIVLPGAVTVSDTAGQPVLALSPDGQRLVFAGEEDGQARLYLRELGALAVKPILGTEGGSHPFFSPDGQWVGFWAEGHIRKVPLGGGEPHVVTPAPRLRGAAWLADDTIVFAPSAAEGLRRVPSGGGAVAQLTAVDAANGEDSHRWPIALPAGRGLLFNVSGPSGLEEERWIEAFDLRSGRRRRLLQGGSFPRFLAPGWLMFARAGALHAVRFDAERIDVLGSPVPVLDDLRMAVKGSGLACFDVAPDGALAYVPGFPRPPDRLLAWVDRGGRETLLEPRGRPYLRPVLSPDGGRLAVTVQGARDDVWVQDLERRSWTRLTAEGDNTDAAWSPDGRQLVFSSTRSGPFNLFRVAADGGGDAQQLTQERTMAMSSSVSPDGSVVAFAVLDTQTGWDVRLLPLGAGGAPRPLVATRFTETYAAFSRDGRYIAYVSNESGRSEVYVRGYAQDGKWPVSSAGGTEPVWSADGQELFFRSGDALFSASVRTAGAFSAGPPRPVLRGPYEPGINGYPNYDVARDGTRFLMVKPPAQREAPLQLVVVPDWRAEVEARISEGRR
jgi:serine/threonine-protein kinase